MTPRKQPEDVLDKLRKGLKEIQDKYTAKYGRGFLTIVARETKLSNVQVSHFIHGRRGLKLSGYIAMDNFIDRCNEDVEYLESLNK